MNRIFFTCNTVESRFLFYHFELTYAVGIDTATSLFYWAICIDALCEPILLSNIHVYRSTHLQTSFNWATRIDWHACKPIDLSIRYRSARLKLFNWGRGVDRYRCKRMLLSISCLDGRLFFVKAFVLWIGYSTCIVFGPRDYTRCCIGMLLQHTSHWYSCLFFVHRPQICRASRFLFFRQLGMPRFLSYIMPRTGRVPPSAVRRRSLPRFHNRPQHRRDVITSTLPLEVRSPW